MHFRSTNGRHFSGPFCPSVVTVKYSMIKLRQTPPRISETTVWNGMKIKPQVEETFARLIAKFGHQRLHGFGGMHG